MMRACLGVFTLVSHLRVLFSEASGGDGRDVPCAFGLARYKTEGTAKAGDFLFTKGAVVLIAGRVM
jgi:hypothetical protein